MCTQSIRWKRSRQNLKWGWIRCGSNWACGRGRCRVYENQMKICKMLNWNWNGSWNKKDWNDVFGILWVGLAATMRWPLFPVRTTYGWKRYHWGMCGNRNSASWKLKINSIFPCLKKERITVGDTGNQMKQFSILIEVFKMTLYLLLLSFPCYPSNGNRNSSK